MLTLNHVTKYYGKNLANDDISFQVDSSQIATLLGILDLPRPTVGRSN